MRSMRWLTLVMASVMTGLCLSAPASAQNVEAPEGDVPAVLATAQDSDASVEDILRELMNEGNMLGGATGACCVCNGELEGCLETDAAGCLIVGGTFFEGVDCDDDPCQAINGSCCLPDDLVCPLDGANRPETVSREMCEAMGGTFVGRCRDCVDLAQEDPLCDIDGVCTFADGTCEILPFAMCNDAGGLYRGFIFQDDVEDDCSSYDHTGACCLSDGSIVQATEYECRRDGGLFQGYGVSNGAADCLIEVQVRHFSERAAQEGAEFGLKNFPDLGPDPSVGSPDFARSGFFAFDDDGGLRVLEKVTITQNGRAIFISSFENSQDTAQAAIREITNLGLRLDSQGFVPPFTIDSIDIKKGDLTGNEFTLCNSAVDPFDVCIFPATVLPNDAAGVPGIGTGEGMLEQVAPAIDPMFVGAGPIEFVARGAIEVSNGAGKFTFSNRGSVEGIVTVEYQFGLLGACCFCDGSCMILSEEDCLAMDGVYQGDGAACEDVECPILGACCLCTGECVDGVTQLECENELGGDFTAYTDPENCTLCDGDIVCEIFGACCLCTGECIENVTETECLNGLNGKTWTPYTDADNCTLCDEPDFVCPPLGACCFCTGECIEDTTEDECESDDGIWTPYTDSDDCILCDEIVCEPLGACCYCTGECEEGLTQIECESGNGEWTPYTDRENCDLCDEIECEPLGACCFCDGSDVVVCEDGLTEGECMALGGLFTVYTDRENCDLCDEITCPQIGACCLCDGTCVDTTQDECENELGGVYQGDCTACNDPGLVCEPFGYCCLLDGTCENTTQSQCDDLGGCFRECVFCEDASVSCEPGACCIGEECEFIPEICCDDFGGVFKGVGVPCEPNPCVVNCRGGCEEKGSLLVFSKIDLRFDASGELLQDTWLQIVNDYPQDVRVQLYFVNGDDPIFDAEGNLLEPGWNSFDNEIELTQDQTIAWSSANGGPVSPFTNLDPGTPPGRPVGDGSGEYMLRGFMLAWAIDFDGSEKDEIRWNHLAGTGTLIRYNEGGRAWEYNACAFQVPASIVGHGEFTGTPGTLFLDGSEYCGPGNVLMQTFQASGSTAYSGPFGGPDVVSDTDITLHPLNTDLTREGVPATTKAEYLIWNENEVKFSNTFRCIYCWDQTFISQYDQPNSFELLTLQTNFGKFRVDGKEGPQCTVLLPDGTELIAAEEPMVGLRAQHLFFGSVPAGPGSESAAAGVNMRWLGSEPAIIRYKVIDEPPQEGPAGGGDKPENPFEAAEMLFEDIADAIENMRREQRDRRIGN